MNIFASPIPGWLPRKQYGAVVLSTSARVGFSLQDALPDLVRFFLLLLFWSVLLRWLYLKKKHPSQYRIQNKLAKRQNPTAGRRQTVRTNLRAGFHIDDHGIAPGIRRLAARD